MSGTHKLIAALAGALVLALVVIAFLLGRQSARDAPPAYPPQVERAPADPTALAPAPAAPVAPAEAARLPPSTPPVAAGERIEHRGGEIVISNQGTAPAPSDAVERYFERMAQLRSGPAGLDPRSFSQDLLTRAMTGDFSGFSELAANLRSTKGQVQGVTPPPECAEYHRLALASLEDSAVLLTRLQDALTSKDPEALTAASSGATKLQEQVQALEALERRLRGR